MRGDSERKGIARREREDDSNKAIIKTMYEMEIEDRARRGVWPGQGSGGGEGGVGGDAVRSFVGALFGVHWVVILNPDAEQSQARTESSEYLRGMQRGMCAEAT